MNPIRIDAREMEHPEPLRVAVGILSELNHDHFLYMLHRKNPIPLIELSKRQGFAVLVQEIEGCWHILIAKNPDTDLGAFLDA